ncbi:MAG: ABC transporter permease [Longimicrobiales bacterium]|nr:ABC transporter permease [Longimicrobiales bacterium]
MAAYRLSLRAFPADFRAAYQADLLQAFEDAVRDVRGAGTATRLRFALRSLGGAVRQGLAERWGRLTGRSGPVPPKRPGTGIDEASWGTRLELALKELRLAARSLARSPGFSLAFVLILGLSLAGATTLWGTIYHVSVAPLGFEDEDRLVRIWYRTRRASTDSDFALSDGMLTTLRHDAASFDAIAHVMITGTTTVLDPTDGPPQRVSRLRVSENFFQVLGVQPAEGRTFGSGDEERDVVLLSHGAWERRFGSSPDVIGSALLLSGRAHTVIGVLPEGFRWLDSPDAPVELWTTYALEPSRFSPFYFFSVARLRPGTTAVAAQSEVEALFQRIHDEHFPELTRRPDRLATVRTLKEDFLGPAEGRIRILVGALALVGLLGAGNVSMLLLIRAVGRGRESAVRVALGGGGPRIAAPFVSELVLLLAASAVVALGLSGLALTTVRDYGAVGLVRADAIGVSPAVLAGGLAAAGLVAVIALAVVALALRRWGGRAVLQAMADSVTGGRLPRSLRAPLVVVQVSVSLVLVAGAGLLGRSFIHLSTVDTGFQTRGVVSGHLSLPLEPFWAPVPEAEDPSDPVLRIRPELAELRSSLRQRVAAHPAVEEVTLAKHAPLSGRYGGFTPFRPEWYEGPEGEMPGGRRWITSNDVDPDFLPFLGAELLEGRWLTWQDDAEAPPVALISEALAESMWPDGDAVGSRYRSTTPRLGPEGRVERTVTWVTVVGVVGSLREWGLEQPEETVYRPLDQAYPTGGIVRRSGRGPRLRVFVRYGDEPSMAVAHLRDVVAELLPGVPLDDVRTLDEMVGDHLREPRFYVTVFGAFGILALTLALGGIAAVIGYGVSRRRREIGVRMALGAWSRSLFRLVALETLFLTGLGIALGLAISYLGGKVLEGLVYGIPTRDMPTLVASAALFMLMALLAALVPTRRALEIDPVRSLRHE